MDWYSPDDPAVADMLRKDGLVLLDGFLSEQEVAETRAQLERYIDEVLPSVPLAHYEFHPDGTLRNMTEMQRYDPWFLEFGGGERAFRLFRQAVPWEPSLFYLETFPKRPGGPPLRPHQELFATPMEPPQYLHLWIALEDVTNDNGGMVFYRRSHRMGLAPHVYHDDGLPAVEDGLLDRLAPYRLDPEVPAGSAVLFDGCTIHGSKGNITDKQRLSIVVAVRGVGTVVSGDLDIFASIVARFYREELGIEACGDDDGFAALGGSAETADRVLLRIERHYGVRLSAEDFAAGDTPRQVAARLLDLTGWQAVNA